MKQKYKDWLSKFALLLMSFLCIYVFMLLEPVWRPIVTVLLTVLTPFFIALIITYLLHPFIEKLHELRLPRSVAVLIIYFLFFGGVGFAIYQMTPVLIKQIKDLSENFPHFFDTYSEWIRQLHSQTERFPESIHERLEERLDNAEQYIETLLSGTLNLFKTFLNSLLFFAVIPFIVFYLLKDVDLIKKVIWYLTPRKWRKPGILLWKDINQSLGSYIRGQLIVCAFVGSFGALGLWLVGMNYPLLLGLIIGLTNIIPYFGPVIGALPAVIIAATISVNMVLMVIIIIFILQMIEGNLLSPLIVGKNVHIHPVVIIFALLLGGEIGGVIGLILAVPCFAVLKVILLHTRNHFAKD